MCSGEEEGNDGVVDIVLRELEMVAIDGDELDLLGLVEALEAEHVVLVEVALGHVSELTLLVELLEPLGLLGEDHGVLSEHHELKAVEGREALLAGGLGSVVISSLVVEMG